MLDESRITIKDLKEEIKSRKWRPYQEVSQPIANVKWLEAALKILEGELGVSIDEFERRFGMVGIEALRNKK